MDERDLTHLRRCVELAGEALDAGDEPFGSVLVDAHDVVCAEDRNRTADGDQTRHPEFALARWAGDPSHARGARRRDGLHLGRALPDVLGRARLGRAGPDRLRRVDRAAGGLASRVRPDQPVTG